MIDQKTVGTAIAAGAAAYLLVRLLRQSRYDFAGKVVFITGGTRGLGLVLARKLLSRGAKVAICARDPNEIARADEDLRRYGREVLSIVCDVTSREDVESAVMEIEARLGDIDVLINNAGVMTAAPMESLTLEDYEEAMRVHFFGPLHTTLAVLPSMKRRGDGRIANVSSIGGKLAVPHMLPYSASKFALTGFTEGLRAEMKKHGILVTAVHPGLMRTGSARRAYVKGRHRAEYAWFSMSAANPLITMSAERAAEKIIHAIQRGSGEVILGLPAKAAAAFHALSTPTTSDFLALIDQYLLPQPAAGEESRERREGRELAGEEPPRLEKFIERPAEQNLEVPERG
jgi:short-subunit dehydrogenase